MSSFLLDASTRSGLRTSFCDGCKRLKRDANLPYTRIYCKRAGPPRRASKSKLRTHDTVCLGHHFIWITFHFTSSVCLCVGYKMETFTLISDYKFRGKINVVNPGDSAKRTFY